MCTLGHGMIPLDNNNFALVRIKKTNLGPKKFAKHKCANKNGYLLAHPCTLLRHA